MPFELLGFFALTENGLYPVFTGRSRLVNHATKTAGQPAPRSQTNLAIESLWPGPITAMPRWTAGRASMVSYQRATLG
jgi:hypothetical protein